MTHMPQWLCVAMRRACASSVTTMLGCLLSLPLFVCVPPVVLLQQPFLLTLPASLLSNLLSVCQLLNHLICTVFALPFVSMYFRMEGSVLHHFLCPVVS